MDNSYIGKTIDNRYEIVKLIGVGGMANVYQAVDRNTGNTVAVKFLKQEFFENEELVRRFKNESKTISILDHPNIIKVIDFAITDREKYIVVEYIDGITLKEYIERREKLSWQETARFSGTILSAIGYAHSNGVVHRDLKPQNIMLLRDGTIKIMDFGIARLSTSNQHTVTDKAIGSVHYISPEQVRGKESDARSDIYSIGIMMYEMLTGTLPFTGETAVAVAMKQVQDTPKRPSEIVDTIPEGLEQIVLHAMEKHPADRYQRADEMFGDIKKFVVDPSVTFPYEEEAAGKTQAVVMDKESMDSKKSKTKSKGKAKSSSKDGKVKVKRGIRITLPVMAGVSLAFFLCSLLACFMIFKTSNNPLLSNARDVELPNFVGMTESEVKNSDNSFRYNIEYVYSSQAEGTVIFQNPRPPKTVKENGSINLRVSKGPQTAQLKDLSGYSKKDAEAYLRDLDVNVSIAIEGNKYVDTGHVIRTDPEMGSIIESGSTVVLYVSTGDLSNITAKKTIPSVIGLTTIEEASKVLAANDFSMGAYTYREDGAARGTIISQEPASGTLAQPGTRVSLVISSGPPKPVCGICGGEHETSQHECTYCHEFGDHDVSKCPVKARDEHVCSKCGQPGHYESECTYTPPTPTPETPTPPPASSETTPPPVSSDTTPTAPPQPENTPAPSESTGNGDTNSGGTNTDNGNQDTGVDQLANTTA